MSNNREWYANYIYQPTDRFAGLPDDLASMVKGELTEGEQILWLEQPSFSGYMREGIWWGAYYPVVGTPLVFFGQFLFYGNLDHLTFGAFLPYIIIPALVYTLTFLIVSKMVKKMAYVVTNRRAMVFNEWSFGANKVKSYYLQHQIRRTNFRAKKRKNGTGNFYFTSERTAIPVNTLPVGFVGIKTVDRVQEILESYLHSTSENAINELPVELQRVVRSEVRAEENLLWIGQPGAYSAQQKSERQRKTTTVLIIALGVVLAFGFVALTSLSLNNSIHFPIFLELGGMALFQFGIIAAILLLMKRGRDKYRKALKTAFVLTNERMIKIKIENSGQEKLESYEFASRNDTTRVKRAAHRDKTADISLVQSEDGKLSEKIRFEDVLEGDKVARLIEQQLTTTVSI